jgi:hypothetical protein
VKLTRLAFDGSNLETLKWRFLQHLITVKAEKRFCRVATSCIGMMRSVTVGDVIMGRMSHQLTNVVL